MKLIRDKKSFIIGVITTLLFIFFVILGIMAKKPRDILFSILQLNVGCTLIINSLSSGFLGEKKYDGFEDERDIHIASKCALISSRIMFYCIIFVALIFGILHIIYENTLFFGLSVSLASCLLLYSIVYLIANIYYEKKN